MSVFPVDESPPVFDGAVKQGVWRRLAQAIDAYCAQRSERILPNVTLRRSKREIARCRQLVRKPSAVRAKMPLAAAARVSVGPSQ
jgi:hypothetical protein